MAKPLELEDPAVTAEKIRRYKPPMQYGVEPFSENKEYSKKLYDFTKKYTDSPEFARKLGLYGGSPEPTRAAIDRFDMDKNLRYGELPFGSAARTVTPRYIFGPNQEHEEIWPSRITVDPKQSAEIYGGTGIRAEPHEMGHIGIGQTSKGFDPKFHETMSPKAQADIEKHLRPVPSKQFQRIRDAFKHKRSPGEARADLHELRFYMHEAKDEQGNPIFDASGKAPFTKEHLDQYRKKTGQHHRLFEKFEDKDVIWMMNNIAEARQKRPGMFTGRERYA